MPLITPFENHVAQYEEWFVNNPWVFKAELKAVKASLPQGDFGIEIGVGTGRFASRLGIAIGLEPSPRMRSLAAERGIEVLSGVAEDLPLRSAVFDFALMVTTICFLDNPYQAIREVHRILKKNGSFIVAYVDRSSPLGRLYETNKERSVFYRAATFYTTDEIMEIMKHAGFSRFTFRQTIFQGLAETSADEPVLPGYGKGSFVVLRGEK